MYFKFITMIHLAFVPFSLLNKFTFEIITTYLEEFLTKAFYFFWGRKQYKSFKFNISPWLHIVHVLTFSY